MTDYPSDRPIDQENQSIEINRALLQQLESLLAAGVMQLPHRENHHHETQSPVRQIAPETGLSMDASDTTDGLLASQNTSILHATKRADQRSKSSAITLDQLREEVVQCIRCRELAGTRTQTVFGVGNPQARLCILGEAPGADEDQMGEPFVGKAGQLLNKILAACKLERGEVYILNVLKCRPPGNRNPTPEEANHCRTFLDRQLQLIHPEFICCMGTVAAQNLLSTTIPIGRLRGKFHEYQGVRVVCTYHPAYLLRTPAAKVKTWDDMKMLMREMGVELG